MQKIIEFNQLSFWTSQPNLHLLNEKIQELNRDGWRVKTIVPNKSWLGRIYSYTLLLDAVESCG